MRKKIGALLLIGSLGALCAGLAACADKSVIEEYYNQGNIVQVTYDGSGGQIMGNDAVTIVDMFNPEKFTADAEGFIHIKLRNPTDPARPHPGTEPIRVLRQGYSLVGWYATREVVKDEAGVVRDDDGNELVYDAVTDKYYTERKSSDDKVVREEAIPQYKFSDPWDFNKKMLDYNVSGDGLNMTLYAAWEKPFSFEYYYEVNGSWIKYGTTSFDYQTAQAENEKEDSDASKLIYDKVFIPEWSLGVAGTGRMENKYSSAYTFPVVKNMTFKAAYSDEARQNPITRENPLKHAGTVDYETATFVNAVQKVYVDFDEGNYYRVSTAEQFSAIADETGFYTILEDELDFKCSFSEDDGELKFPSGSAAEKCRWANKFIFNEFTGRIEGENGKKVTFKNIGARYSDNYANVGLFGSIGGDAVIKNIAFENVILEIKNATSKEKVNLGLFAGTIEDGAVIENVTIGGDLRLWNIELESNRLSVNLIANGDRTGVTAENIKVTACGTKSPRPSSQGKYEYSVDFHEGKTTVDADGNVTLTIIPQTNDVEREFEGKNYIIINHLGGETV